MIAINRTFDEEAMRAGLKNKTLGTLLFPKDPIRNAPEIIRNLITTFPAEEGCYLFGLLMKIGWFSPTLVHLDIAIMVEFGKRMRVIVLGMISALLPTQENDLVRLHMDALGLIDMDQAVGRDRRRARRFAARAEVRAHRRDGAAREHAARAAQLRDGRRRVQPALRAAGELPDAQAHHHRARVRQQPAADVRGLLRDHVQHDPVRRAGASCMRRRSGSASKATSASTC